MCILGKKKKKLDRLISSYQILLLLVETASSDLQPEIFKEYLKTFFHFLFLYNFVQTFDKLK